MGRQKVLVLGSTGMLGAMVVDTFSRDPGVDLAATVREKSLLSRWGAFYPAVSWAALDAERSAEEEVASVVRGCSWVVNCIGVIKPYIRDDRAAEVERAIRVNALFPHLLGRAAEKAGAKVLQIATDCVYSGAKGKYRESDPHDALDVYGKTKSLGEANLPNVHHLRCSIIGPEHKSFLSLLEWFRRQPEKGKVGGFVNHEWNGVTTLHFARLCLGIVRENLPMPRLQHVVPDGTVTKESLLRHFSAAFGRGDILIDPVHAKTVVDRTLGTENEEGNLVLWNAAGYPAPPSVPRMVEELGKERFPWQVEGR
jgi:dTDP-4-dehydrorhamnose reductase